MLPSFSKTYKHIFMSVFSLVQSQMSLAGHKMPLARFGARLSLVPLGRPGAAHV
jgi:hypothetical protein